MAAVRVRSLPIARTRALRHSILRPGQSIRATLAAEPVSAHAVGAFDGGKLIAAGLIAADAGRRGSWRVRGMATEESARRRGAGTAVLAALLDHARGHGARSVWGNIRTPARSLYERAGFRTVSDEFELPGIGPHFRMELTLAHSGGDDPPRGAERRGRGGAGNRGAARARASRSGGGDVRRRPS